MWNIWLRHCLNGRQERYRLDWPHLFYLPDIVRFDTADDSNIVTDDAMKKKAI